jgi:hypothetical protein
MTRPTELTPLVSPVTGTTTTSRHPAAWRIALWSAIGGFLLTVVWSAAFVDRVIGENVATALLGQDPAQGPAGGVLAGVLYAFATGIAGTFTACNVAVLGSVVPLVGTDRRPRLVDTLRPLGWTAVGLLATSAAYGALVGLFGTSMPQFATAPTTGLSARSVQSMIAFGLVGAAMLVLGLAAIGLLPDPLARLARRFPNARSVVLGVLIGAFLIGRPWGLFRAMFRDAANSGNPFYGASAFALQSLGNVVVMALLVVLLVHATGGRVQRWLLAKPGRIAAVGAAGMIAAGVFTILYWDLRPLSRAGIIWYPRIPW